MKLRLRIALRNIFRHRGRTAVSLSMIAGAVIGLVIFNGFIHYILINMQNIVIENDVGHLQVGKQAFWNLSPGGRKTQLLSEGAALTEEITKDSAVDAVSGRLSFFGLLSSGEVTVSAKGMGFDPVTEPQFERRLKILEGQPLGASTKLGVMLGIGLKKKLNVAVGDTVTALGYTLDGVVNAMDLTVVGVFSTVNSEIDNNLFMLSLSNVQTLLDTDKVDVLSIHLHDTKQTNAAQGRLQTVVEKIKPDLKVKSWYELGTFYRQVEQFFSVQNLVIEAVLLTLVFLGIMNTVGMAIFERTGEIGTVRALGESDRSIIGQFTLEGFLLGLIGAGFGGVLAFVVANLLTSLHLNMELPGTSVPTTVEIHHVPLAYLRAMIIVTLTATVATWYPALRAVKMSIVEALRKNI